MTPQVRSNCSQDPYLWKLADVGLQKLARAGLLTILLGVEPVQITLTATIVERLATLLEIVKVPTAETTLHKLLSLRTKYYK